MKRFGQRWQGLWVACVLAVGWLTLASARAATAAELKPMVVVSVPSTEKLIKDITYLTEAAGAGDVGRLVALMVQPYTAALDKTKPAGALIWLENNEPAGLLFLPVKDLKIFLATFEEQIGKPEDAGDGVLEIAADKPKSAFVKEKNGWAYVSDKKTRLAKLPDDPVKLLGGLHQEYTLGVRAHLGELPGDWRQMAITQLRKGFEERIQHVERKQEQIARKVGEGMLASVVTLIEGVEQLSLGWQVAPEQKITYLDFSITALPGSDLAKQLELVQQRKSAFAGFLLPEAAVSFHVTGQSSDHEIKQLLAMLQMLRGEAMKGIESDKNLRTDQEREKAKAIVDRFLQVAEDTVQDGKSDAGAVLLLKPKSLSFAAGGAVADGTKLADALKDLVAFAKDKSAPLPEVKFDAEKHAGVTFHTVSIPLQTSKEEARVLLGDPLQVVVGTGADSAFLAFGQEPRELLKKVIDQSASGASKPLPPGQLTIALTPILELATSMNDNPALKVTLDSLKQTPGEDRILIKTIPVERGLTCRLQLEAGVVKVIGEAARMLAPLIAQMRKP